MNQIVPRGEKICPWQVIADERTDGRTDHYRAPTERAPNKTTSIGRIDTVPQTGQISSLQILKTVTFSSPLRLWLLNWPNIKRREMTQFGRNQKIEKISVDRDTAKGNLSWFNTVYAPRKTTVLYMMCWKTFIICILFSKSYNDLKKLYNCLYWKKSKMCKYFVHDLLGSCEGCKHKHETWNSTRGASVSLMQHRRPQGTFFNDQGGLITQGKTF